LALVCIDREQAELAVVVDRVLLGEHEDQAPEIANQPSVDRIITLVGCHENLGHDWNQSLK